jgi:hypothetical protein
MNIFHRSNAGSTAKLPLHYAESLSHLGRIYCASSRGEANRYPGGFDRPVVRDPDVFVRRAGSVLKRAIKDDPALRGMYSRAWSLSSELESSTRAPYRIGGPSVGAAVELAEITSGISETLAAKNLTIDLSGRQLRIASEISSFALRIIGNNYDGLLYPGMSPDVPVNTHEYWTGLQGHLQPTPQPVAA